MNIDFLSIADLYCDLALTFTPAIFIDQRKSDAFVKGDCAFHIGNVNDDVMIDLTLFWALNDAVPNENISATNKIFRMFFSFWGTAWTASDVIHYPAEGILFECQR